MAILFTGIKQLLTLTGDKAPRAGAAMRETGMVKDAAVLVEGGLIEAAGTWTSVSHHRLAKKARKIEVNGVCLPGFVDSHTHAIFAEPRLKDFSMRTAGASYQDIKAAGGGILSSIGAVRRQSQHDMARQLAIRATGFIECGTTTAEVKTGYGLSLESELKMLRALREASELTPLEMLPTLLAAHSVPPEFNGEAQKYLNYVIAEILPKVAAGKLAIFADIFCESGYFTPEQTTAYLKEAARLGFKPKVHSEQLSNYGGTLAGIAAGAISADHADYVNAGDIGAMRAAGTIAALLPASNYYLGLAKYPPARELIAAGVPVALATDFNPGTCPAWNMQFVLSAACTHCGMTPEEAICAATVNGAWALGIGDRAGSLMPGMQADLSFFEADDYRELGYYFGANQCVMTVKKGKIVYSR
ncbi:MAG: imidazolonepropionase [Elusimicrobia bacterium CG_4_10_14_0_2_um_filter_56_8]|nr:MAG: imidazolonepropionase [Elusimicrobia bacterium CG1_02_56_21]PJA12162.1 MAG: imidazolonepropionase [Elusimicrobia bacterium CG_4_10_14_0_2_um_filter_56_8]